MKSKYPLTLIAAIGFGVCSCAQIKAAEAITGDGMSLPHYTPDLTVSGKLAAAGSEVMTDMMKVWVESFNTMHPGAEVTYTQQKSLPGNITQIGPNTKEIFDGYTIEPFVRKYQYDPLLVAVSFGAYLDQEQGIFVHPDNPLAKLTLAQLDAIYGSLRRRGYPRDIKTWGDLGLTGEWADKPVHPYNRGMDNQVSWWFRDQIMLGGLFRPGAVVPGDGKSPAVVDAIATDRYGICYLSFTYQNEKLKPVALASGETGAFVLPSPETLGDETYPLARPYLFCINRKPGGPIDPLIKEFVTYVLSAEGQEVLVQVKCIPLSPRCILENRHKLD